MVKVSNYDLESAYGFLTAWARAGASLSELKALTEKERGDLLSQFLGVLRGYKEVRPIEYIVDCRAAPFEPEGLKIEAHKMGRRIAKIERRSEDNLFINGKEVAPHPFCCRKQHTTDGSFIKGLVLREVKSKLEIRDVNVLGCLVAHQELIPSSWKKQVGYEGGIYFWSTRYSDCGDQGKGRGIYLCRMGCNSSNWFVGRTFFYFRGQWEPCKRKFSGRK